ncbi:MAG: helix-turn-helix domain-containing protein [Brevibacterium aurantiacum]|uniref:helix-turn-helix domain-containing protein n=1 Tax=Brevibacterium aurantiacum TaxID=273384 RepID=UPI00264B9FDE|nr:helix-turn-helix domain-containing protein [Brevibacterium aurantiacum]
MYTEMRIPQLRAALWTSTPDGTPSSDLAEVAVRVPPATIAPAASVIVPDGCMDLIVIDSRVVIAGADSSARTFSAPSTHGEATGSASVPAVAEPIVGLRFDPGVLPQLLATSAAELVDQVTPLDAVIGRRALGAGTFADDSASRLVSIAEALTSRVEFNHRPVELAMLLDVSADQQRSDIAEVAAQFAYSPRQLRRLSADWFGYGPKHLAKVLRWQAARAHIDAGRTRTAAAAAAGYADAAHLWRDEKSLLGL